MQKRALSGAPHTMHNATPSRTVAGGPAGLHTERMLLQLGWIVLAVEALLALAFGFIFWYFWSRSAMESRTAKRAIAIYALGCLAILALTLTLPL